MSFVSLNVKDILKAIDKTLLELSDFEKSEFVHSTFNAIYQSMSPEQQASFTGTLTELWDEYSGLSGLFPKGYVFTGAPGMSDPDRVDAYIAPAGSPVDDPERLVETPMFPKIPSALKLLSNDAIKCLELLAIQKGTAAFTPISQKEMRKIIREARLALACDEDAFVDFNARVGGDLSIMDALKVIFSFKATPMPDVITADDRINAIGSNFATSKTLRSVQKHPAGKNTDERNKIRADLERYKKNRPKIRQICTDFLSSLKIPVDDLAELRNSDLELIAKAYLNLMDYPVPTIMNNAYDLHIAERRYGGEVLCLIEDGKRSDIETEVGAYHTVTSFRAMLQDTGAVSRSVSERMARTFG